VTLLENGNLRDTVAGEPIVLSDSNVEEALRERLVDMETTVIAHL
jgi:hypothetical protein